MSEAQRLALLAKPMGDSQQADGFQRRLVEIISSPTERQALQVVKEDGGRDRDRTCDPYHVKVVLSR